MEAKATVMSWEKTVLAPEEIDKLRLAGFAWNNIPGKSMLEPQAKQSYKNGYNQALKDHNLDSPLQM